jgi:hypothetical protein
MRNIVLSQNTVAQSIAFDTDGNMYIPQVIQDNVQLADEPAPVPYATRLANGDLAINRLSPSGVLNAQMYLRNAGHGGGSGIGSEPGTGKIWLDGDSSGSGFARALSRVTFANGAILDSPNGSGVETFRPFGSASGSHGLACCIDSINQKFAIRRTFPDPGNGRRYYLYDLRDASNGVFNNVLHQVDQAANQYPSSSGNIGTFQGFQSLGNFLYTIEGDPLSSNTYISCLDWRTGVTVQRQFINAMSDLYYREPEGLAIQTIAGVSKLVFGFSSGTDNGRNYNLAYIPVVKPFAANGTFGRDGYGTGGYGQ